MEKYFLPPKLDFIHLRKCLDEYTPESIFIRKVGSKGGATKVNQKLKNKKLDFKLDESGLLFLIDEKGIFKFPMKDWGTRENIGFNLTYERFYADGRQVFLTHGNNPYDPNLLEPQRSILRNCGDGHYLEIYFEGRVNLKFFEWIIKPDIALWTIQGKDYRPE